MLQPKVSLPPRVPGTERAQEFIQFSSHHKPAAQRPPLNQRARRPMTKRRDPLPSAAGGLCPHTSNPIWGNTSSFSLKDGSALVKRTTSLGVFTINHTPGISVHRAFCPPNPRGIPAVNGGGQCHGYAHFSDSKESPVQWQTPRVQRNLGWASQACGCPPHY